MSDERRSEFSALIFTFKSLFLNLKQVTRVKNCFWKFFFMYCTVCFLKSQFFAFQRLKLMIQYHVLDMIIIYIKKTFLAISFTQISHFLLIFKKGDLFLILFKMGTF